MNSILSLQRLAVSSMDHDFFDNSNVSITCGGNSCNSDHCTVSPITVGGGGI